MHLGTTELFLGHLVSECRLHDRRTARKQLTRALHHDVEVSDTGIYSGEAGDRPQYGRHDGNRSEQLDARRGKRVSIREVCPANLLEGTHTAARGVQEPDVGDPPLQCPSIRRHFRAETAMRSPAAPAADGEVAAADDYFSAIDLTEAIDSGLRDEGLQLSIEIGCIAHQAHELPEAAFIREEFEALSNGQLALRVLPRDTLLASHPQDKSPSSLKFIKFGRPLGRWGIWRLRVLQSSTANTVPSSTASPMATRTDRTSAADGALTGTSIFMDSTNIKSSPSATVSPTETSTSAIRPCTTERTSTTSAPSSATSFLKGKREDMRFTCSRDAAESRLPHR